MSTDRYILGISAHYHDSAATLIKNGVIEFAAQEERFTRVKNDFRFPINAVTAALEYAQIDIHEVEAVAYYESPKLKYQRILHSYARNFPKSMNQFLNSLVKPSVSSKGLKREIRNKLGFTGPIYFGNHHKSHAASAFFPSNFDDAAILTMDGVGEWTTSSVSIGKGNKIIKLAETRFPHSLGLLYSAFTQFCGFKVNSGEYKLMGLAPYGEPKYLDTIKSKIASHDGWGSIHLEMQFFDFEFGKSMINESFETLMGARSAKPEESTQKFYMDIAASIQAFTDEVVLGAAGYAKELTGNKRLCLAGGVALNCVSNGNIVDSGLFDEIWVQPAAGDAGGSLGVAFEYWHQVLEQPRIPDSANPIQKGSYLGREFSDREIFDSLLSFGATSEHYPDQNGLFERVAKLISEGKVIGWFQGRSEFGPRALGNRSILGDPRSDSTQSKMNLKIKFRESFRPFAPAILLHRVNEWFEVPMKYSSPYMLLVAKVKGDKLLEVNKENVAGLDLLGLRRSEVPAITHVDNSARIQTVDARTNPKFYLLIEKFFELTNVPILVNTSFNVRGEPIVETPKDAYKCFMRTDLDYLCIGSFLLEKSNQPDFIEKTNWREAFKLD